MWVTVVNNPGKDKYTIHQMISGLFTYELKTVGRVFSYSLQDKVIKIHSERAIDKTSNEIKFSQGQSIYFSSRVSPSKGTYRDENGNRHRMTPRRNIEDVFSWLGRRLAESASITSVSGKMLSPETVVRPCGKKMVWPQWLLAGELQVIQPKTFDSIITMGVGQGASFGLGLIDIEGNT